LGITPVPEALKMARGLELDLVEVAPMANPPVCRIMDYGKFRYEEAQKAKESRRKSSNVSVKEVKFRPKIGRGDFDVKVRKVDQFIHEGHKVKVTLQFRGREMAHPELGTKILDQVLDVVGTYVKVETQARLEGRNMSMVLSPDKTALAVKSVDEAAPDAPAPNGDVVPVATEAPAATDAPADAAIVAAPAPAPAVTPAAESPAPEPATATEQATP
jgi:translation initiation factor IF-3